VFRALRRAPRRRLRPAESIGDSETIRRRSRIDSITGPACSRERRVDFVGRMRDAGTMSSLVGPALLSPTSSWRSSPNLHPGFSFHLLALPSDHFADWARPQSRQLMVIFSKCPIDSTLAGRLTPPGRSTLRCQKPALSQALLAMIPSPFSLTF
jgi:hypothetical protein